MSLSHAYLLIAALFLGLCAGLFQGLNAGLYWSAQLGPKGACEAYRFSVYDCTTFSPR